MAQVLVVATTTELIGKIADALTGAGHAVTIERDFRRGAGALDRQRPALLISEVRLGEFNGLHLMIRARLEHPAMRAILLDRSPDAVLEADAHRHGAVYLVNPETAVLLEHVSRLLGERSPHRRFPRKSITAGELVLSAGRGRLRVLDQSYGGLRVEVSDPSDVESGIDLVVPGAGVAVRARPVWMRPAPTGQYWCGAELSEPNPQAVSDWCRLVDSVHAA
jgi:DNA-binding response OmpR family regulator